MENSNITKEEVQKAYRILKKSIYYENNVLLSLKMKIANFEEKENFLDENKRTVFFERLATRLNNNDLFEEEVNEIKFKKVIKKLDEKSKEKEIKNLIKKIKDGKSEKLDIEEIEGILSEKIQKNRSIKYNYIIDCPIELHIIAILWILKEGYKLDKEVGKYSYGYRLNFDERDEIKSSALFKEYVKQYQDWKNKGIKKAKEIVEEDENAVLISLDLKRFYYGIDHNKLKEKIGKIDNEILNSKLTEIVFEINKKYDLEVFEDRKKCKEDENLEKGFTIPIGLYSSPILANLYLKELDEKILEVYPSYYGRYVDDLFLVFKEYRIDGSKTKEEYLKEKLNDIISDNKIKEMGIEKSFNEEILIENEKHDIVFLNDDRKKAEIESLENNFLERASTFAFLPNEKEIEKLYNKISIEDDKEYKNKKYDVSVYLAKILDIFSGVDKKENLPKIKKIAEDLLEFFSEENIVKYFSYYEKIFILLVMGELTNEIQKLYEKVQKYFSKLETDETVTRFYTEYLNDSLYFALSLNPRIIKKLKYDLKKNIVNSDEKLLEKKLEDKILLQTYKIAQSNMFRHKMINYPLLNYLKFEKESSIYKEINFFEARYFNLAEKPDKFEELELCKEKIKLSPRFIHLEEFNIFYIKKHIFTQSCNLGQNLIDYLEESKKNFELNFTDKEKEGDIFKKNIVEKKFGEIEFYKITSNEKEKIKEVKIGIASLSIAGDVLKVLDGKQDLTIHKKERLIEILNEAKRYKVDILVFPEVSIPFQWLKFINEFSRKNKILITGGLEHIYCPKLEYNHEKYKKEAFNYLFTTLPFATNQYKSSFIKIRLKNHYAPEERNVIEGKRFAVPKLEKIKYDIFSWKGIHFSNFNCFELSDIEGRSKLKNYIDLLIASVFNKDLYYFKNILESTCRDLHVFVAQSNTSIYGDCEIIQPTKKDYMTIASLKGGINDNLLVGKINVEKLREFQLLENIAQKDGGFKLTPPGIDPNIVKARMENKIDLILENKIQDVEYEGKKEILRKKLSAEKVQPEIKEILDFLELDETQPEIKEILDDWRKNQN